MQIFSKCPINNSFYSVIAAVNIIWLRRVTSEANQPLLRNLKMS